MELIWRTPSLRRGAIICVILSLVATATEVAVALSLVPILASLGVGAGSELTEFVSGFSPTTWLLLFSLAAGARSTVNWLSSIQSEHSTQEVVVILQSRLYRALANAHWDTVRRLAPSSITSTLQSHTYEAGYGFNDVIQLIAAILLVSGYLVSAVAISPVIALLLILVLAFMWWLNARKNIRVLAHSKDYVDAETKLHQRYDDWVAISRISSLGVDTDGLVDRFEAGARNAASHAVGYSRTAAATHIGYEAAVVAAILAGVPIAWLMQAPPALLAFGLVLIVRVLPQASSIQVNYQSIINAVAPLQSVDHLSTRLELDPVLRPTENSTLDWQKIELVNLGLEDTVRDVGRRWILNKIDLSIRHGEWLAVTGPTGAGKSTLAEAMLMLLRPDAGEIRIDGIAVDDTMTSRWRDQAAYVPQDVVLLDATIRDNLRLYVPYATDDELRAALRHAAADFVMTRLPDALDTRTGPGGRWLSGGEKQRIGIARALLRRPGFLVLDEPTAALDANTQAKLMDALSGLDHTMSVILITHRPELLRLVDRIIEIEDGKIHPVRKLARSQIDTFPCNGKARPRQ